jgi:hypothetical protein
MHAVSICLLGELLFLYIIIAYKIQGREQKRVADSKWTETLQSSTVTFGAPLFLDAAAALLLLFQPAEFRSLADPRLLSYRNLVYYLSLQQELTFDPDQCRLTLKTNRE